MSDVFISYSRRDKAFVQTLHHALRQLKRDTWVDWQDIQPTEEWWKAIETGIEAADTFIAVLSPDYVNSPICHQETEHAVKHHKRLVPIVYREVDPQGVHHSLSAHNWLFMRESDDFDSAFKTLLKSIDTDLKHVKAHTRLLTRAIEWDRNGRDQSFLLRDRDLEASEQWLKSSEGKDPSPTDLQIQYITASQVLRQHFREFEANYHRAQQELKQAMVYRRPAFRSVVLSSVAVTALVLVTRFLGFLQPLELAAYDQLMRSRPSEGMDDRFLIVEVTDEDIQTELQERGTSLSDQSLERLLDRLEPYQPRLIGLDLYRDFQASLPTLAERLQQDPHILMLCKVAGTDEQGQVVSSSVAPPDTVPRERVGFSDVVRDGDGVVRRHLLLQEQVAGSDCLSEYAFNLLLARRYLEIETGGQVPYRDPLVAGGDLQLGSVVFKRLQAFTGGYQFEDVGGYQILLNYRSHKDNLQGPFERISLGEVLDSPIPADLVKDRIVLVGVTATHSVRDYLSTPYGTGDRDLPGVVLQAHLTSQILDAVLEERPLLWVWPQWGEALWIGGWSLVGGVLAWRVQRLRRLGFAVAIAIGGLLIICFVVLSTQAGWIPLVPSVLGLAGTSGLLVYLAFRRPQHPPTVVTPEQAHASSSANQVL